MRLTENDCYYSFHKYAFFLYSQRFYKGFFYEYFILGHTADIIILYNFVNLIRYFLLQPPQELHSHRDIFQNDRLIFNLFFKRYSDQSIPPSHPYTEPTSTRETTLRGPGNSSSSSRTDLTSHPYSIHISTRHSTLSSSVKHSMSGEAPNSPTPHYHPKKTLPNSYTQLYTPRVGRGITTRRVGETFSVP